MSLMDRFLEWLEYGENIWLRALVIFILFATAVLLVIGTILLVFIGPVWGAILFLSVIAYLSILLVLKE